MLPINTQGHRWWRYAYFGLKYDGESGFVDRLNEKGELEMRYKTFTVEWYWLPEKTADAFTKNLTYATGAPKKDHRRLVRLETAEHLQSVSEGLQKSLVVNLASHSTKGAKPRDENGRLIESGRNFTLRVDPIDFGNMKCCLQYAWLATRMASLSGAAEAPDDLDTTSPPLSIRIAIAARSLQDVQMVDDSDSEA